MRLRRTELAAACLLVAAACRSVDPNPHYDEVVSEIRAATGSAEVFHPAADRADIEARVAELLQSELGLTEAVELGLLNNPSLQAAFHDVGMAHADRVQAGMLTNPSLDALLRFPTDGGATVIDGGLFGSLLDIWQIPERERVADRALQGRIFEVAHRAAVLAGEIRVAHVAAAAAERELAIAEENRESAAKLFELAEARLEAAAGTTIDANLARLELLDTEIAFRDAELAAGERRRELLVLLGLVPWDASPRIAELADSVPPPLLSLEDLESLALTRRLDVRAAQAAVAEAAAEVERQRGLVMKKLDVGVVAEQDEDWSAGPGVRVELPLFDQNQAQIAKAREALSQRELLLAALELSASKEVNSALARAETGWKALAIYREDVLTRSEATLEQARESYRLGKTTLLPALEAQRQLLAARSAYAERLARAATALSDLECATGAPLDALIEADVEQEGN